MNIHLLLQMAAEAMGEREALVCDGERLTYADIARKARRVAALCKSGEKIGYLAETSPLMPAALFGAALAGTHFIPLNYRLPAAQISRLLKRVTPIKLFTNEDIQVEGVHLYSLVKGMPEEELSGEAPDGGDGIAIELFTSGTTGEPKSALLGHENIMSYVFATTEFMGAGEEEATLVSVPPYHIAGISAILSSTYAGRRMVQLTNFTADKWLTLARTENITHAFLVPTMLQRIVEKEEDLHLPALRHVAYGGGRMPLETIEKAMDLLPEVNFTNAYGLTETSSTVCLLTPEAHRSARTSNDPSIRRRLSSVGVPLPSIELEVRQYNGTLCLPEQMGLVYVRGDQVSGTYKEAGSQLDADGWFPTKDRGFLDAEGYLFLDGRDDDVIVRGGENISPGEIEDIIRRHPAVKDAAVVAVPDIQWGEAVGACIVVEEEVSDEVLCALVKENLRSSRVPSVIKRVAELPYTETGKLLRRVIRDDLS